MEIAGAKNKLRFHVGVLGRVQTLFLHAGHVQDVYFRPVSYTHLALPGLSEDLLL